MNRVVISIGSNSGDRQGNVGAALTWLGAHIGAFESSAIYETQDAVKSSGRPYMNAVAKGETDMDFEELNNLFKEYEKSHGRTPEARDEGLVPIDIDIVVWNGTVSRQRDYCASFFRLGASMLGLRSIPSEAGGSLVEHDADE